MLDIVYILHGVVYVTSLHVALASPSLRGQVLTQYATHQGVGDMQYTVDSAIFAAKAGDVYPIARTEFDQLQATITPTTSIVCEKQLCDATGNPVSVCQRCRKEGVTAIAVVTDDELTLSRGPSVLPENRGKRVFYVEGKVLLKCVGEEDHSKVVERRLRLTMYKV